VNRTLTTLALTAVLAVPAAGLAGGPALAREGEAVQYSLGSCGDGVLAGDFFLVEKGMRNQDGLNLHLSGTITRTGGHETGRYAEVQADRFEDGESYAGALSHLVVPGRGSFTVAGRAVVGEDGSFSYTKNLSGLVEDDWTARVCAALA
jgi:hypothetical protein